MQAFLSLNISELCGWWCHGAFWCDTVTSSHQRCYLLFIVAYYSDIPDSKIHGANMGRHEPCCLGILRLHCSVQKQVFSSFIINYVTRKQWQVRLLSVWSVFDYSLLPGITDRRMGQSIMHPLLNECFVRREAISWPSYVSWYVHRVND